ncbi:hypothetical protein IJI91_02785 [Candidatus Saccharibacteria bacterium]|nr:hypothetical protein [Candidatus Saccharibacteria bacterium]
MKEQVEFRMRVDSKELPRLCQVLMLVGGLDPEVVFRAVEERLDVLTDYRWDISEVCEIAKVFISFMKPERLIHKLSKSAHHHCLREDGDKGFLVDLHREWKKDGLPPDSAVFFMEYCMEYPEYTQKHFSELLEKFDLQADDLLRRLNAKTLEDLRHYYLNFCKVQEDGIDNFFCDYRAAGGDIERFADKFIRNYDFSVLSEEQLLRYREMLRDSGVSHELIDAI